MIAFASGRKGSGIDSRTTSWPPAASIANARSRQRSGPGRVLSESEKTTASTAEGRV